MDDADSSRKRPRTTDYVPKDLSPIKDQDLWFEDGNIIVIARNAQAFRVHMGVLSRHSAVFQGLFTLPQPTQPREEVVAEEAVDGCPVVNVPDSAYDVKHLLHALYDGVGILHAGKTPPFSVLTALARLSYKYEVEDVFEVAVSKLRSYFNTTYAEWKRDFSSTSLSYTDTIEAINLFREIDEPEMLPCAFYFCTMFVDIPTLLRGTQRADGTLEKLSAHDLELVMKAREDLSGRFMRYLYTFFTKKPTPLECKTPGLCDNTMANQARHMVQDSVVEFPWRTSTITTYCAAAVERYLKSERLCMVCAAAYLKADDDFRKKIWARLLVLFNIVLDDSSNNA